MLYRLDRYTTKVSSVICGGCNKNKVHLSRTASCLTINLTFVEITNSTPHRKMPALLGQKKNQLTFVLILVKPPLFEVETIPEMHAQVITNYEKEQICNSQVFKKDKPVKSPVGFPFSPPVGSIRNVLSLTPPITTSSKAPQGRSLDESPARM